MEGNRVMPAEVSVKSQLRAHIRSVRRASDHDPADRAIAAEAAALVLRAAAPTVAAYVPLEHEPGGRHLVPALAAVTRLLLPVLQDDNDLDWALHDGGLTTGRFGLLQPTGPRLGRDAVADADLVLLPGLAAAPDGTRLGQGGGSYDRVLPRVRGVTIVLLYPGELRPDLPAEPHDQPVCGALIGYEPAHVNWTKECQIPHHWHSKYQSANDGG